MLMHTFSINFREFHKVLVSYSFKETAIFIFMGKSKVYFLCQEKVLLVSVHIFLGKCALFNV